MSQWINNIISVYRNMPSMDWRDLVEILIIAFLVYHIMIWIKSSKAWVLLKGMIVILIFLLLATLFEMNTILWIAEKVLGFAVTALIIVLQPELRKVLEELGKNKFFTSILPFETKMTDATFTDRTAAEITRACAEMAKVKTGALIVIQRQVSLTDYERTGIDIDALVTSQLLINIFEHNTPLHDGAVIIKGNRISSATCYLPLSDNANLSKDLGTRHRAGVGISEISDSFTVIVSEETGHISVAEEGRLERKLDAETLRARLLELRPELEGEKKKTRRIWGGRSKAKK